jgi:ATP-dependent Clp protease ATP-binding subunit ClpA
MNIQSLIREAGQLYREDPKAISAYCILQILQEFSLYEALECTAEIKKAIHTYIPNTQTKGTLFNSIMGINQTEPSGVTLINKNIPLQQAILQCPELDEHVVLLAAVKTFDQLTGSSHYRKLLRELLDLKLHKLSKKPGIPLVGRENEISEIGRLLGRSERNNVLIVGPVGVGKTVLAESMSVHLHDKKMFRLHLGHAIRDVSLAIMTSERKKSIIFS